jgi:hypothetical protein
VEIPFTRAHWEATEVAPQFPLARGWQRQLDIERHPIFYDGPLNARTYGAWLREHGVRFVALPNAVLDYTGEDEGELVRDGLPYLRLRWSSPDWRLYDVTPPGPMVVPEGGAQMRMTELASDSARIEVTRAGAAVVRIQFSPYWVADGACVEKAGEWTRLTAPRSGTFDIRMRFSPGRLISRGRRCG